MAPLNTRRETREFCLQFLYHFQLPIFNDSKKILATDSVELFDQITTFRETLNVTMPSQEQAWVSSLAKGLLTHIDTLEEMAQKHLKNWKLHASQLKCEIDTGLKKLINTMKKFCK